MAALAVRTAPLLAGGALMLASLSLIFLWVPTDAVLGVSQRIFYFHVPLAWVGFLAFGVVFVASVAYLWRGGDRWDSLAFASAEIGMLFMSLLLVTGVLWSKASWQVWWTWSPQLTTSLLLWLIYAGYLMLRAYGPVGGQGARYAAVVGIIGFFDVPIVYMAAKVVARRSPRGGRRPPGRGGLPRKLHVPCPHAQLGRLHRPLWPAAVPAVPPAASRGGLGGPPTTI